MIATGFVSTNLKSCYFCYLLRFQLRFSFDVSIGPTNPEGITFKAT
ncbi:hypothetical protein C900_02037 [Fulvivirga imtechensis AK7]|uniref:Uncharacterized protein n=1 Tax=Fulvivirga imtechensis AK7 TaxID=1237149 RepID=L8JZQ9_9BACT|nr:hypothetical protein C900_02037 [Fulvivirga imtechensis AK7]